MSNEVNLAAPGRVMRNLSGEQARAHERMANLPRRVISRQPTEADVEAKRQAVAEKIQRTFKNNALNLKSNPGFTGRKG
jgi:glycerol-3-phosphate dehydrogenase